LRALGAAGVAGVAGGALGLPRALQAASGESAARAGAAAGARDRLDGVGVQLYTLRDQMRADPEATLARIAQLGFGEIEWWGDYGRTPVQLRALLDRHGLRSPAWHLSPNLLEPARLDDTIRTAAAMGHRHLIVAWLPQPQRSPEGFARIGELLSVAGRRLAREGIRAGYHNHDFEFAATGSGTLWDVLLASTDASVVDLELDCYWAFKAGHDPIAMLQRHRDRITHLHLKDSAGAPEHRQVDVGQGVIDWTRLLEVATAGRVRHVFVEHDAPADAWATVQAGRAYLRGLGY
jgi:sugar phosphate isomerase/epimerase